MAGVNDIVVFGYGAWSTVAKLPTAGYATTGSGVGDPDPSYTKTYVGGSRVAMTKTWLDDVRIERSFAGDWRKDDATLS
jgi:hypothetical protein